MKKYAPGAKLKKKISDRIDHLPGKSTTKCMINSAIRH
jgi:hypothetical protein